MMTAIVDALWLRLHAILTMFADRLAATDPTLLCNTGCTANDVFLLRGYLGLQRYAGGDEIAITIDVWSDGQKLNIEADACTDSGEVIAAGPSALLPLVDGQTSVEAGIGNWLREFEQFLKENEPAVMLAASGLT